LSGIAVYGSFGKPAWLMLTSKEWNDYPKKEVSGKRFSHETVVLDGYNYVNCTFDQVTFAYDGTAPFSLSGETAIVQPILLQTRNMRIGNYLLLLEQADFLPATRISVR
jgi:hypothetical protein